MSAVLAAGRVASVGAQSPVVAAGTTHVWRFDHVQLRSHERLINRQQKIINGKNGQGLAPRAVRRVCVSQMGGGGKRVSEAGGICLDDPRHDQEKKDASVSKESKRKQDIPTVEPHNVVEVAMGEVERECIFVTTITQNFPPRSMVWRPLMQSRIPQISPCACICLAVQSTTVTGNMKKLV